MAVDKPPPPSSADLEARLLSLDLRAVVTAALLGETITGDVHQIADLIVPAVRAELLDAMGLEPHPFDWREDTMGNYSYQCCDKGWTHPIHRYPADRTADTCLMCGGASPQRDPDSGTWSCQRCAPSAGDGPGDGPDTAAALHRRVIRETASHMLLNEDQAEALLDQAEAAQTANEMFAARLRQRMASDRKLLDRLAEAEIACDAQPQVTSAPHLQTECTHERHLGGDDLCPINDRTQTDTDHVFVSQPHTRTCFWRMQDCGGRCEHLPQSSVHRGSTFLRP